MAKEITQRGREEIARRLRQVLEEISRLQRPVAAMAAAGGSATERVGRAGQDDLVDSAQLVGHREELQMTSARLTERARRVRSAIDRLESGHWGVCEVCSEPIGARRLAALPDAATCVDCQTQLER